MPINPSLLEILICPACHGELAPPAAEGLACKGCRRLFPVRDGIPVMLVEEARLPAPEEPRG